MRFLPCYLWAVFLAASIPCFLAWYAWPSRSRARSSIRSKYAPSDEGAPSILWLTPACTAALGECAEPAVLANASESKIETMLERAHYPPGEKAPQALHYRTWPEQAAMLASGKYEALRSWQKPWQPEDVPPPKEEYQNDEIERSRDRPAGRDLWLVVALLLLTAAMVAGFLVPSSALCVSSERPTLNSAQPVTTLPMPKPIVRLELSTDAIFDYKMPGTYHPAVLSSRLKNLFDRFEGIEIKSVSGHTDPIGSTEDNEQLGRARANTVLDAIRELTKTARAGQFKSTALPAQAASGGPQKEKEDADVWRYCFDRFQLKVTEARFRPLRNLDPSLNEDHRPLCTTWAAQANVDAGYPACAAPYDKTIPPNLKIYARQAENFREMTSCLSPMRHVVVNISFDRQLPPQS